MDRSTKGLEGAGEWHVLKTVLPSLKNKRVLDLGCGFGWHCQYAIDGGAKHVVGVDISHRMIDQAKATTSPLIEYQNNALEEINFSDNSFDVVISSLTFHYIKSWDEVVKKVAKFLQKNGEFIFSVEHPIFTSEGQEEWFVDEQGNKIHWPVDNYFTEGLRTARFLDEKVVKYHKTLTTYINTLIKNGFQIEHVIEPEPEANLLKNIPHMKDELRRPMMLIIKAKNIKKS